MRSPRGLLAALVFLLAFPLAMLYQALFGDGGGETVLHIVWGTSFALVAFSVFDFEMPRWLTWMGCVSASASATIFLLQGASQMTQIESLTYLSFEVLGQVTERLAIDLLIAWFVAVLLFASQGKTRLVGLAVMSIAVCLEAYSYGLNYFGTSLDAEAPILRLLFFLPFVWLLLESRETRHSVRVA